MRLTVRVIPRSSKNSLTWEQETLKARLMAPPVEGAANEALIALLAQRLGLSKRSIRIVQGATGRQKIVEIADLTPEEVRRRIE
jgi:uncharacterized protein (TIGR00251 family)